MEKMALIPPPVEEIGKCKASRHGFQHPMRSTAKEMIIDELLLFHRNRNIDGRKHENHKENESVEFYRKKKNVIRRRRPLCNDASNENNRSLYISKL